MENKLDIFEREKNHMIGKISLADYRDATFGHGPFAGRPYDVISNLLQVADIYKQMNDNYEKQRINYEIMNTNYQKIINLKDRSHTNIIDLVLIGVDWVLFMIAIGAINIRLF